MAKFYYGGQAVIEGVMMRGQRHMAVAVRAPDGRIVLHEEPLNSAIYRHPAMKLPFLRGIVGLWDALGLGMKALMFSANVALQEEAGKDGAVSEKPLPEATFAPPTVPATQTQGAGAFSGPAAWTSVAFSVALMIGVFFVLPVLAAGALTSLAGLYSSLAYNLIEAIIRLGLFLGYLWAISFMPDIKRLFGYHGAEHKTINAYEAGEPLTPEYVQRFTLLNPRCGTTFLLIVLLLATILFVLIGKPPFVIMALSRIILVPVVAAVAYEFIRLMAGMYNYSIVRAIMAPGLALQKMTTRPPDQSMLEVGIAALNAVLVADGVAEAAPAGSAPRVVVPASALQEASREA